MIVWRTSPSCSAAVHPLAAPASSASARTPRLSPSDWLETPESARLSSLCSLRRVSLEILPVRVPMIVSHAVFCTRIASSRSTGTSNSSSAAHFMATAALRCADHKKTKTDTMRNSSYKKKVWEEEGRGWGCLGAQLRLRQQPPAPLQPHVLRQGTPCVLRVIPRNAHLPA
jgi:hypothetical protein